MNPLKLLLVSALGFTSSSHAYGYASPLEDPSLNPWLTPLNQCAQEMGKYQLDMDMGFLNTDYFCRIDQKQGVIFLTKDKQVTNRDAARLVLNKINSCQSINSERILVGASRDSVTELQNLLKSKPQNTNIQIGKRKGIWSPPETHAKIFQLGNGIDQFFTVHGSLNLQTVGLTCKANNALRFTEANPVIFGYFRDLGDAVETNTGKGKFAGAGTDNSSGTHLPMATIGDYQVQFYAGKGTGFVGNSVVQKQSWQDNINPSITNQHALGVLNWYDNVIFDAAKQLRQGREVTIDVLIFEIGHENAFITNLWNFVQNGFENGKTEDKTSKDSVAHPYIGKLNVRFLWQFQSDKIGSSKTYTLLNGFKQIGGASKNTQASPYILESARIWPILNPSGIAINPGTPRDMHNKLAILNVQGHEEERKIYVTSSNLDTPNVGSGKLWQAGTIISAKPGSSIWSGNNTNKPNLWNAYQNYFDLLWSNREGQPNAGQIGFSKLINDQRVNGAVNWIETVPPNSDTKYKPKEGIDAFFFPIPFN